LSTFTVSEEHSRDLDLESRDREGLATGDLDFVERVLDRAERVTVREDDRDLRYLPPDFKERFLECFLNGDLRESRDSDRTFILEFDDVFRKGHCERDERSSCKVQRSKL
jgi:hypothetical protein